MLRYKFWAVCHTPPSHIYPISPFLLQSHIPPICVCVCQGIDDGPEGLKLISDIIRAKMGIDVSVLMGANIANEVAAERFCETTIGKKDICMCGVKMKW